MRALESEGELTVVGHLRGSFQQEWKGRELEFTFDSIMSGQVAILEREDKRQLLTTFMHQVYGPDTSISFTLKDDPKRLQEEERERNMHREVEEHPIVQLTKEIFHGKIVQIKKGENH